MGKENRFKLSLMTLASFVEPWVMPTRILRPGNGDGLIPERAYCEVYETGEITNQLRH